jgi:transcriptional regulator with XRE-family HTH domain
MPRRLKPDAFAVAVGGRIRELREEAGLTMEKLAYESDLGSKGHLSNLERGLARPTIETLRVLAERLGCLPLDFLTFPSKDPRQALIESTRTVSRAVLRKLARDAASAPAQRAERTPVAAEPPRSPSPRRRKE